MNREDHAPVDPLIAPLTRGRLIVCSGPGGVGKTTTAAALGLRGAIAGRKVIVLTIDPAKRLATSLGLEALTNDPQRIDLEHHLAASDAEVDGELWAMMLDQEQTLEDLVRRFAPDKRALERSRKNNIYKLLSSALHGMTEYMALEKLHDLYTGGYFDLVVLDTPPTKNALDFLETPERAARFFDERIVKWFLPQAQDAGFLKRVFNPGSVVQKLLGKIFGESFVADLIEFFDTFQFLIDTLKQRGEMIEFILRDPATFFLVVTSADPRRIHEALFFHEKLAELDQRAHTFIINRITPDFRLEDLDDFGPEALSELLEEDRAGIETLAAELANHYRELAKLAKKDRAAVRQLAELTGGDTIQTVPILREDVHSINDLLSLSQFLTPHSPLTSP